MIKDLILKVLDRHKNGQLNLESSATRKLIAEEIEAVLKQNEQIIAIERELYRGEG
tara:strand:- start:260 stop:427 length:168 start_codon:yes stop_codon:yes gene_type:complete